MYYKQMCVQQGYVPSTCTMNGKYCWMLVNSQGDPCKGCNENRNICNGRHTPNNDKFLMWRERLEQNEQRQEEIIQQRKREHLNNFIKTLLEIRWDRDRGGIKIELIVKDIVNEKAYYMSCQTIDEMLYYTQLCCYKYNIDQIHIEENTIGIQLYDALNLNIKNIDIVPLRYTKMQL